jgi:hypothetical protein
VLGQLDDEWSLSADQLEPSQREAIEKAWQEPEIRNVLQTQIHGLPETTE